MSDSLKTYEALGRFVEAFEGMVHETRSICIRLLTYPKDVYHHDLVQIALHHQSLTAKPILEIFRGLIIETVNASIKAQEIQKRSNGTFPGRPVTFSQTDREAFLSVLKVIADEYSDLVNKRNSLLHAAWFIGYDNSIDFDVHKYAVTKEGLSRVELPTRTAELLELCVRCNHVVPWLHKIEACVTGMCKISDEFQRDDADWIMIAGRTTLPQKSV